jgi:pilus assembly protein Flp/PilA
VGAPPYGALTHAHPRAARTEGSRMYQLVHRLAAHSRKDDGATAVEYGLIVSLIAIVIIAGVTAVGTNLLGLFNNVATKV